MPEKKLDPRLFNLSGHGLVVVTLWGEARGEPIEGQIAVAQVIQNRLKSGRWGDTYHEVLGRWAQFSCLWPELGGLNYQSVLDIAGVIDRGENVGEHSNQQRLLEQLEWVTMGVLSGTVMDNTSGATHYFVPSIVRPSWAKEPGVRTATIGRHEFWAQVP